MHALDFVGDVRNHLHGLAQELAAPLLVDDRQVDLAGRVVRVAGQRAVREPLVVAQVEVGLAAVVEHVDFAVLIGAHRARIDVDVRIELLHPHAQAACFEQHADRGAGQPFASELTTPPVTKMCLVIPGPLAREFNVLPATANGQLNAAGAENVNPIPFWPVARVKNVRFNLSGTADSSSTILIWLGELISISALSLYFLILPLTLHLLVVEVVGGVFDLAFRLQFRHARLGDKGGEAVGIVRVVGGIEESKCLCLPIRGRPTTTNSTTTSLPTLSLASSALIMAPLAAAFGCSASLRRTLRQEVRRHDSPDCSENSAIKHRQPKLRLAKRFMAGLRCIGQKFGMASFDCCSHFGPTGEPRQARWKWISKRDCGGGKPLKFDLNGKL